LSNIGITQFFFLRVTKKITKETAIMRSGKTRRTNEAENIMMTCFYSIDHRPIEFIDLYQSHKGPMSHDIEGSSALKIARILLSILISW
jgi:hypothetical protein